MALLSHKRNFWDKFFLCVTSNSLESSLKLVVKQMQSDHISVNHSIAPGLYWHKQLMNWPRDPCGRKPQAPVHIRYLAMVHMIVWNPKGIPTLSMENMKWYNHKSRPQNMCLTHSWPQQIWTSAHKQAYSVFPLLTSEGSPYCLLRSKITKHFFLSTRSVLSAFSKKSSHFLSATC